MGFQRNKNHRYFVRYAKFSTTSTTQGRSCAGAGSAAPKVSLTDEQQGGELCAVCQHEQTGLKKKKKGNCVERRRRRRRTLAVTGEEQRFVYDPPWLNGEAR